MPRPYPSGHALPKRVCTYAHTASCPAALAPKHASSLPVFPKSGPAAIACCMQSCSCPQPRPFAPAPPAAFEVSYGGTPIFSKLDTGRMPTMAEVAGGIAEAIAAVGGAGAGSPAAP